MQARPTTKRIKFWLACKEGHPQERQAQTLTRKDPTFPLTHLDQFYAGTFASHCSYTCQRLPHLSLEGAASSAALRRSFFRFSRYRSLLTTFQSPVLSRINSHSWPFAGRWLGYSYCGLRRCRGDLCLFLRRGKGDRSRPVPSGHSGVTGACPPRWGRSLCLMIHLVHFAT